MRSDHPTRATIASRLASLAALAILVTTVLCPNRLAAATGETPDAAAWRLLESGAVILFRHAEAPGVGDPPGFRLDDCSTQRNLSENGRVQARRIGEAFRAHGILVTAALSSQWCRTQDTAELAFPGLRRDEPVFNSFFRDSQARASQTRAARELVQRWRGPGVLVVFTHEVNITALTGVVTSSGEGLIVQADDAGAIKVVGRLIP